MFCVFMQERGNIWLDAQTDYEDPAEHKIGSYLTSMSEVTNVTLCFLC
jgi:hypothetical protein